MKIKGYFSKGEQLLWLGSVWGILLAFFVFGGKGTFTLIASLIGVTSLIFNAKGNPFGQLLMILFSLLYGLISWSFSYYGEMITYLGMTAPMALFALISWLKNPYKGNRAEVAVNRLRGREYLWMLLLTAVVTMVFYFLLKRLATANLFFSTLSVATSFIAVYLTFRRSPYFALAYASNDIVLIILWLMAAKADRSYISVIICFLAFLINDLYGFINWRQMQKRQKA
ncbi:MAG: nicotinamide mononucleotide transporter [Clostridia bacterium]|nr:nicotinamide mononucleotide transporter [Clostridia bacterium]